MSPFWIFYGCVAFVTWLRAAYGMYQVKDRYLDHTPPGYEGVVYLSIFVMSLAMGICWFLYWPMLGSVMLFDRYKEESEEETEDERGALEREGPCQFCGRKVSQYEVPGDPQRSFVGHERPWCDQYAAIVAERGRSAEHTPKDNDGESEK